MELFLVQKYRNKEEDHLQVFVLLNSQLDNKIIFGRMFHVRPAQKREINTEEKSSYKKLKKQQMHERHNDNTSWNTLILNPNTIIEGMEFVKVLFGQKEIFLKK
ncbi:unnamed protein product (macronuclear) [Paramecium tetraurelia]|uniref:Uncharacterized protein n=1 Tax=Paramecium tetraurelia TaxID=5888 RepID=A0CI13_PARTE|nr:uncharacterized protein GSPATT00038534001 [Paramecium tetraurelia]CAK70430.1 unnamed protein product [Paramecium tetraurelia]|eukprot:XP_001437827.1 hypothetical protein (macronuclear) [Paramecium tetraurelia strain d4-2]